MPKLKSFDQPLDFQIRQAGFAGFADHIGKPFHHPVVIGQVLLPSNVRLGHATLF